MNNIIKRILALALTACVPLVFSACGGGGGGGGALTAISGRAVKGPIKGALVQIFKLNSDGSTGELLGHGTSGSDGSYLLKIPAAKAVAPLLVSVTGKAGSVYTSESTGLDVPFTTAESFRAAIDVIEPGKVYAVSPLTEAAYEQVQKFLTDNPAAGADTRIISAANARVAALFNVSDILADPASQPSYQAALTVIDQMVKDSGTTTTQQTMNLINNAFADVTGQSYQHYLGALNTAAVTAVTLNHAQATVVNAVIAAATNPPAEPDWADTTPPDAVTGISATASAATAAAASVSLQWNAATTTGTNSVTGYDVYRNGVKIASVAATSYVDSPLALGTVYRYYLVAFDAAGNRSALSVEIAVTTPIAPNLNVTVGGQLSSDILSMPEHDIFAPTAPATLSATSAALDATTGSVQLSWSAATDNVAVTAYEVYRDNVKIATVAQQSYLDSPVLSNVTYAYFVKALDAAGNSSAASSVLSVKPLTATLGVTVGGQVLVP